MNHTHFYKITADNHRHLGQIKGELFKKQAHVSYEMKRKSSYWAKKVDVSSTYYDITKQYFPLLIEEVEGYAEATNIPLNEFWTMSLEDELDFLDNEKCTSLVTNNGMLTSHNEDWSSDAQDAICILEKTIGRSTTLELYYYNTLGGVSCSVNSNGFVMMINTLNQNDRQIGVPRNIIARYLSQTENVEKDFKIISQIPRSQGFNHVFVKSNGDTWDLESTARKQMLARPTLPFVHTNHYLLDQLKQYEATDNSSATFERYKKGCENIKSMMTIDELMTLNTDSSNGSNRSIMNERTIGKMIVDWKDQSAKIWLKRESEKGWIDYKLDFLISSFT